MGPMKDIKDLSGRDYDAPKSDKCVCVCVESHIGQMLGRTELY